MAGGTKPTATDVNNAIATSAAGVHRFDFLNTLLNNLLSWLGNMAGKDTVAVSDLAAGTPSRVVGFLPTTGAPAAVALDGTLQIVSGALGVVPGSVSGGGISSAFATVTDGTTTALASGADALRFRVGSTKLSVQVVSNDAVFGDYVSHDVVQANLDHALIGGQLPRAKLTNGTSNRVLGYDNAGVPAEITIGSGLTLSAGVLSAGGGGSGLLSAYVNVSDGATTASASGGDTLRVRAGSNRVSVAVGSNDASFGDNIAIDVTEANLLHANIGGTLPLTKLASGTASVLLGRNTAGAAAEVVIGANLTLSGGVLAATVGAAGGFTNTPVKTAAYTAAVGERVRTDSTAAAFTVTLPGAPADGSQVALADVAAAGSWSPNAITLQPAAGDRLNNAGIGGASAGIANTAGGEVVLTYYAAAAVWSSRVLSRQRQFQVSNNLSEGLPATMRSNLGLAIGTNVQAWDTNLDTLGSIVGSGNALKAVRFNAAGTDYEAAAFPGLMPGFYAGPASALWLRSGHWTGNTSTATPVANTVYMIVFLLPVRLAPTKMGINVATAAAGTCDVTLFAMGADTKPSAKLANVSLSTGAAGTVSATIAPGTLEAGWYVTRVTFSAAPVVRGHQTALITPWGLDPTASVNTPASAKVSTPGTFVANPAVAEDIATFADTLVNLPYVLLQ